MEELIIKKIKDFKLHLNEFDFKSIKKRDKEEVWSYLEEKLNDILDLFKDDYFIDKDILKKMEDIKSHLRAFLSSPMYTNTKVNTLCREYIEKELKEFEEIVNSKYC